MRRLIESRLQVVSLLVSRRYTEEFAPLVPHEVPVLVVDDAQIEKIIGFNFHRGVLAHARRPEPPLLDSLFDSAEARSTVVVVPDLQDPENLGTLIRTALAFGVRALVLGSSTPDPFTRRVLRTSMGAVLQLPIVHSRDLRCDLQRLKSAGFQTVATVTDTAAKPLDAFARAKRLVILFGNEGHGLSPEWVERCDDCVTIPMQAGVDSLNAAIAAGIVLYRLK